MFYTKKSNTSYPTWFQERLDLKATFWARFFRPKTPCRFCLLKIVEKDKPKL